MESITQQLEFFCQELPKDQSIEALEDLEDRYKKLLQHVALSGDLELAYAAAQSQQKIGFLLKYKSYGIKASTPLGFSLFFLEPGQGFSFQRHQEVKTETFYFLTTPPKKSFAYLCESNEWEEVYDEKLFSDWLGGTKRPSFDQYCYTPEPGDVMQVERPGVVHTAIGCVLEEYANVSTDRVDRLHDQNRGNPIPAKFSRGYFLEKLKQLSYPEAARLITRQDKKFSTQPLKWQERGGIKTLTLNDTEAYHAEQIIIPPGEVWHLDTKNAFVSFFVAQGSAEGVLGKEVLHLKQYDTFLSVPGCAWEIRPISGPMRLSVLAIQKEHAFL